MNEIDYDEMSDEVLMERVRAARAFSDGSSHHDASDVSVFLSVFHPEMDDQRHREIVDDVKERRRSR